MYNDPELNAMSEVYDVLKTFDPGQVNRILSWAANRLGVEEVMNKAEAPVITQTATVVQEPPAAVAPVPETPPETAPVTVDTSGEQSDSSPETQASPQESEQSEQSGQPVEPVEEKPKDVLKGLGLKRYKTIENLFLSANVNSVSSRILLAAAYLQEKKGLEELSSYDINSRLKKLGYGVPNITNSINSLLNKNLMKQTRKQGDSKQAKRKFVVTSDGLQLARTYLGPVADSE